MRDDVLYGFAQGGDPVGRRLCELIDLVEDLHDVRVEIRGMPLGTVLLSQAFERVCDLTGQSRHFDSRRVGQSRNGPKISALKASEAYLLAYSIAMPDSRLAHRRRPFRFVTEGRTCRCGHWLLSLQR